MSKCHFNTHILEGDFPAELIRCLDGKFKIKDNPTHPLKNLELADYERGEIGYRCLGFFARIPYVLEDRINKWGDSVIDILGTTVDADVTSVDLYNIYGHSTVNPPLFGISALARYYNIKLSTTWDCSDAGLAGKCDIDEFGNTKAVLLPIDNYILLDCLEAERLSYIVEDVVDLPDPVEALLKCSEFYKLEYINYINKVSARILIEGYKAGGDLTSSDLFEVYPHLIKNSKYVL